jgi:hypothetical protein
MRALAALLVCATALAVEPAPGPMILAEEDLRALLRDAAARVLPEGVEIAAVHSLGGLTLRGGGLAVTVDPPAAPTAGRTALRARLATARETRFVTFQVDLVAPGRGPVVRRGASVIVEARSGAVTVTADGEAQQDGALGQRIHVLCPALRRVLVARVVDASTVRIDLGGAR